MSVTTAFDDPTLAPRHLVERYRDAFRAVYEREPVIRYMGNHWYFANGVYFDRLELFDEIIALTRRAKQQRSLLSKRTLSRLIDRIRSL